jgi:two-component system sensor histidine kinase KdpD
VNSQRIVDLARWLGAVTGLVAITAVYDRYVHGNATTVALTYLLFILFLSARWGLRYAIASSIAATACYNFFFLPPVHTFTVSDPQNLLALAVLLITSVVSSRMSERIRQESRQALVRKAELEVLYSLSRALLQTDELAALTTTVPSAIATASRADAVIFYLLDGDRTYRVGSPWPTPLGPAELRALANVSSASQDEQTQEAIIPIRTGVRPRGVLLLRGVQGSLATLEAVGGLVSVSLDRAQAVDAAARAEGAKESERLRTMMMDSITHEFRSPLTAIKVSVSTLRTTSLAEEGSSELLAIIEEEADHLDQLVAQSVEMSQLDTLDITMTFSPQSMAHIVEQSLQTASQALAQHPVEVALPVDLPEIEADPVWLSKLMVNLLENAAKYSAPGSTVFITAERCGDLVSCSVADRGVGIDPLEQGLIFDKFYRSRQRSANISGTGLGLAICRAIIEAHGGSLQVTSQPGYGSVFTMSVRKAVQQRSRSI